MRFRNSWFLAMVGALAATSLMAQESTEPAGEVFEDVIVVTASRVEQPLNEAPASITVLDQKTIESIPADDYSDLLRNVPGLNVSQTSARDINITARGATNTLATSSLVLVDGRSLYLDFFGFVMWDFLPVNPVEIKQIEAVRGPGSAVWGANAMTGVVNVITKRPKEIVGTSILLGGGEIGTKYGSITHAGIAGGKGAGGFGYKLSGGFYQQDAYERPATLTNTFENEGTKQPKAEVRLDWDLTDDSYFSFGGGTARTDGIIHTGIGPFKIDSGTKLSYAKLDYNKQAFHVGTFWNGLDADSQNLLSRGTNGQFLGFAFKTDTYNFELSNTSVAGTHHILTYGGDYRKSKFDLEIAPKGTDKKEYGAFVQDEILLGDKVRWLIGGRYDNIDPIDGVFTPRTSLLWSPTPGNTFRVSYNEAFRTPSVINDYLDATILVQLGAFPIYLPATADGNVELSEESLKAYEVGYVGSYSNGMIMSLAAYRNKTKDSIDFYTSRSYGGFSNLPPIFNPALGYGVPPALVGCFLFQPGTFPLCPLGGLAGLVPSNFSYRNIGETTDQGLEFSLQQRFTGNWSWFFNASWQDKPEFEGLTPAEELTQNLPPEWRGNVGFAFDNGGLFFSANANYQDSAFWADVPFATGTTDSFTMVNAEVGMRFMDERMTLKLIGANIFDEKVQQHIFGDIISRKVTAQVGFRF
jgi:outer membrane receptor protein involved in Fe transport